MAKAAWKPISTKLSGAAGLIEINRRTRNNVLEWITSQTYEQRTRNRRPGALLKLEDYLNAEEFKSVTEGLKEEIDSYPEIVNFNLYKATTDVQFEVDIVLQKSNLKKAKEIYRKLLKSKSQLDGLRGSTVKTGVVYTLRVEVGDTAEISDGIHRLARLLYGIMKYRFNEDI